MRTLKVTAGKCMGFSTELLLMCSTCEQGIEKTYSSPRCPDIDEDGNHTPGRRTNLEINVLLVFLVHELGLGFAGLQKIAAILGMDCMSESSYWELANTSRDCVVAQCEESLQLAVEIVKQQYRNLANAPPPNDGVDDIDVSYDASWHKRGYSSHHGLALVIDLFTGLCVDYGVLSNFCLDCLLKANKFGKDSMAYQEWMIKHIEDNKCCNDHNGAAGSMEQAIAVKLWGRSVAHRKLRYVTFLSDGDSKAYNQVHAARPYGPDKPVHKEECVNHVGKRLGTALRKMKKAKKLGGKGQGRLTEKVIDKLQVYYTRAVRLGAGDPEKMHTGVLCTLLHSSSTDEDPRHRFCPEGETSWCFFNRAIAKNEQPGPHAENMTVRLSRAVVEEMKPTYIRLSDRELMERCNRGKTQNANEGLHSLIWRRCPKTVFVGRDRIEEATASAVGYCNQGGSFIQSVLKRMGIRPSHTGDQILKTMDAARVDKQQMKPNVGGSYGRQLNGSIIGRPRN
jgi:hypothetical protein